jgi:hypothetical protein
MNLNIPESEKTPLVITLLEIINEQSKKIEALEEEIHKLKKETTKPKIKKSKLNDESNEDDKNESKKESRKGKAKRKKKIEIHEEKIVKPKNIPKDAKFVGYYDVDVQDIIIKPHNTRYKLAQYVTKEGKYITAKLPNNAKTKHFGVDLCSFILYQYHHQHVTQPLLLEQLKAIGIDISSGQLSNIITENLEEFHEEKNEILKAGLTNPNYIQTDDTGARHNGVNGYCTQIGNEFFTWFQSTQSKSRINFLELLSNGVQKTLYTFNEMSLEYMQKQGLATKWFSKLENVDISITDKKEFEVWLKKEEIISPKNVRIVTESALIGGLTKQGIPVDLSIVSDGARQFNIFDHALCWVHAERGVNRLIPLDDRNKELVASAREEIWTIYQKLKEYKLNPSSNMEQTINKDFDKFSGKLTEYEALNKAVNYFKTNKSDLLKVLNKPYLPLHNNLSERDIRDYVKKRKISGSTRSEEGRRARDTFASIKKTCKKLGVSFLDYLKDRLDGVGEIPCLGGSVRVAMSASG